MALKSHCKIRGIAKAKGSRKGTPGGRKSEFTGPTVRKNKAISGRVGSQAEGSV